MEVMMSQITGNPTVQYQIVQVHSKYNKGRISDISDGITNVRYS